MNTATAATIDVRSIAHHERHQQIFGRLAALPAGASLQLLNDHDPLPLRYQLDRQWPGQFSFDYLESGPDLWRLEIRKAAAAKPVGEAKDSCCSGGACCG